VTETITSVRVTSIAASPETYQNVKTQVFLTEDPVTGFPLMYFSRYIIITNHEIKNNK
jgi:hypothetical protein